MFSEVERERIYLFTLIGYVDVSERKNKADCLSTFVLSNYFLVKRLVMYREKPERRDEIRSTLCT